jgi:hypothetical protein
VADQLGSRVVFVVKGGILFGNIAWSDTLILRNMETPKHLRVRPGLAGPFLRKWVQGVQHRDGCRGGYDLPPASGLENHRVRGDRSEKLPCRVQWHDRNCHAPLFREVNLPIDLH